jgi:hypothetical protein
MPLQDRLSRQFPTTGSSLKSLKGPTNGDLNLAVEGKEKQQQLVSGFYLILQTVN